MEKLFAALKAQHLGFEVVDVRLLANQLEVNGRAAVDLDAEFADAITSAVAVDIASLS